MTLPSAEYNFKPGASFACDVKSPSQTFVVSFEDDGKQAHFYGVDPRRVDKPILDARLIYEANDLAPDLKNKDTKLNIMWDKSGRRALLLLDDHAHAVIDFVAEKSYCRTGKPYFTTWLQDDFTWKDRVLKMFL